MMRDIGKMKSYLDLEMDEYNNKKKYEIKGDFIMIRIGNKGYKSYNH